jgi:soluble lytic murein transglycosylase-like protein
MATQLVRTGALARALLWLLLWQPSAHADVWGFVDEKGIAHFAAERLDERYELYFTSREGFDTGRGRKGAGDVPRPATEPAAPAKLLAFFDVSPNYKQVKHLLREAASEHQIDYELLQALIATESGFDARAVSPRGAVGLMQLMPVTARHYGVLADKKTSVAKKLTDPRINIRAGSLYLRDMISRFPGRLELALAAYNAGLKAVRRAGNRVPRFKETQNFVKTVLQLYALLKPPSLRRAGPQQPPLQSGVAEQNGAVRRDSMTPPRQPPIQDREQLISHD